MKQVRCVIQSVLFALLFSCFTKAQTAAANSAPAITAPGQLIAMDLVGALVQIAALRPDKTSLYLRQETEPFAQNLRQILAMVGYRVTDAPGDGISRADYRKTEKYTELGVVNMYQVNVGDVKVRRDYLIDDSTVQPVSTIYIQGADASVVTLNDELFNVASQGAVADVPDQSISATLSLQTVDGGNTYSAGQPVVVTVSSTQAARLHCYYRDGHGQVAKIYPNRFNTDSHIPSARTIMIPATDEWSISATRVGATDDFLCIAVDPDNHAVVAALDEQPDLEPLAIRSLQQIVDSLPAAEVHTVAIETLSLRVE